MLKSYHNHLLGGLLVTLLAVTISACYQQNDVLESYPESDGVKSQIPFISFDLTSDSHLKGVNKITISSTRQFDENYYGFDASVDTLFTDLSGLENSDFFLENLNANLSIYSRLDNPSPLNGISTPYPFLIPFDNGSFPDFTADPVVVKPTSVITKTVSFYTWQNQEIQEGLVNRWLIEYSDNGFPQKWIQSCIDSSTNQLTVGCNFEFSKENHSLDHVAKIVVSFESDPRTYSSFYASTFELFDLTDNLLGQKVVTRTGTETNHEVTNACYKKDGVTLTTDYCEISDSHVGSAAKKKESLVYSGLNTKSPELNITIVYFNEDGDKAYLEKTVRRFNDNKTLQVATEEKSEYSINTDSKELSLIKQEISEYSNGFLTQKTENEYVDSTLSQSVISVYQRDMQGRITDYQELDENGNPVLHVEYRFDDDNRLIQKRSYGYTNNEEDDTPKCGDNMDFSYARDSTGNTTKYITNYCDGNSYQSIPFKLNSLTYNSRGLLTSRKHYLFSGSSSYINFREDFEYDENGFNTKIQYYSGEGNAMQAAGYTIRECDAHLFLESEKHYDVKDDLIESPSNPDSKCQDNAVCYSVTTYDYLE